MMMMVVKDDDHLSHAHSHIQFSFDLSIVLLGLLEVKVGKIQNQTEPNRDKWEAAKQKEKMAKEAKSAEQSKQTLHEHILKRKFINDLPCGKCY